MGICSNWTAEHNKYDIGIMKDLKRIENIYVGGIRYIKGYPWNMGSARVIYLGALSLIVCLAPHQIKPESVSLVDGRCPIWCDSGIPIHISVMCSPKGVS